jgi:endonuclease/exonuclease/phosphatase family metal-dependent hydrolase
VRSQAFSSPTKRGLMGLAVAGLVAALCLLLIPGAPDAASGQTEPTANAAKKKKKKKKKPVRVMTQNLYFGTDLTPLIAAINAGQPPCTPLGDCLVAQARAPDNFVNEVGFALKDIETNNFRIRAQTIGNQIKKHKPDLVGLQEVALIKLQIPVALSEPATAPLLDFSDTLLDELNKKARTKKQCGKAAKKRKAQGKKPKPCYRGYKQVTIQQEADLEQPGDFDNDPGPNGVGGQGPPLQPTAGIPQVPCTGFYPYATDERNPGNDDTGSSAVDPPFEALGVFDYNADRDPTGTVPNIPSFGCGQDLGSDGAGGVNVKSDCPDDNPNLGETHTSVPGAVTDPTDLTSTCMIHGLEGEVRLQLRDAIIVRKGAGVKIRNPQSGNYGHVVQLPLGALGTVPFDRGWTSVQATVRGRSFHFLNTHLEDIETGTIREDQASELIGPGTPGAVNKTVLVGDLNSDPSIDPGPDPVNDNPESNIAFNRLAAAGYVPLQGSFNTWGHAEILNNPNDNTFTERIDWIMTNSPSITMRSSRLVNAFAKGLWGSDHGGVLSVLNVPGKKGKKKK